jgi:hypothetical protein
MIDLPAVYELLRRAAAKRSFLSRQDLARRYQHQAAKWRDASHALDEALSALNAATTAAGLPPIGAIVTEDPKQGTYRPPTTGFWGSPGVPECPPQEHDAYFTWMRLVIQVHVTKWPPQLGPASIRNVGLDKLSEQRQ